MIQVHIWLLNIDKFFCHLFLSSLILYNALYILLIYQLLLMMWACKERPHTGHIQIIYASWTSSRVIAFILDFTQNTSTNVTQFIVKSESCNSSQSIGSVPRFWSCWCTPNSSLENLRFKRGYHRGFVSLIIQ